MVHGRVVNPGPPVLAGQRFDLLLQLLGVQAVVHAAPGVARDGPAVYPHPGVVRQTRVTVVLDMRLWRHVLHLLKHSTHYTLHIVHYTVHSTHRGIRNSSRPNGWMEFWAGNVTKHYFER